MLEIGLKNKKSTMLNGQVNCNNPTSRIMESQERIQLMPTSSVEGRHDATFPIISALNSAPLPSDPLCVRVNYICKHDFRAEAWYLQYLCQITFYIVGVACAILPWADGATLFFTTVAFAVLPILAAVLIGIFTIPLCGIVNSIQHKDLSQRHCFSVVRLAIDLGIGYRVSRGICFLGLPVAAAVAFAIVGKASLKT